MLYLQTNGMVISNCFTDSMGLSGAQSAANVSQTTYCSLLKKEKDFSDWISQSKKSDKTKTPLTEIYVLSRTNKTLIRGATLIHGMTRALSRIPTYPRQMTSACNVAEYFVKSHLTAPSAVHLTTCFSPDSQHHRLSVEASLPLSPLQRFELFNSLQ